MPSDVVIHYEHKVDELNGYLPNEKDHSTIFYETFVNGKLYRLEYVEGSKQFLGWLEALMKERIKSGRLEEYKIFRDSEESVFLHQVANLKYKRGPMRGRYANIDGAIFEILGPTTMITANIEYSKGKVGITKMFLVIDARKMENLFRVLDKNFKYKLLKVSDASHPLRTQSLSDDIRQKLTDNQMRILKFAFKRGYYTYPKKVTLEDMADELSVNKSTVFHHIQRAEQKIIQCVLEKQG